MTRTKRLRTRLALLGAACVALVVAGLIGTSTQLRAPASTPSATSPTTAASDAQVAGVLDALPLYFIENDGQLDPSVLFHLKGQRTDVYFTSRGLTFSLTEPVEARTGAPAASSGGEPQLAALALASPASSPAPVHATFVADRAPKRWRRHALELDFLGANPATGPAGEELTPAVVSYFRGPQEQWRSGLKTYEGVRYRELWTGIDLVYRGESKRMKYDFFVEPGADPNQIRLAYRGADSIRINHGGQLEVSTPHGAFRDERPIAYQTVAGRQVPVPVEYDLDPTTHTYGFRVGRYDRALPLVIDPEVLAYAGYIGGASGERGLGIEVDATGNAYVAGQTCSAEDTFPPVAGPGLTQSGNCDAFVAKVTADGTGLVYVGYLGGSEVDFGDAIAVDAAGHAYITGWTRSSDFPVTVGPDLTYNDLADDPNDIFDPVDAFVAKISTDGTSLVYSGYIGGEGLDFAENIAVDAQGNAYVTGITSSEEDTFPVLVGPDLTHNGGALATLGAGLDAFVVKVKADGTGLDYCGYIGGHRDDAGIVIGIFGISFLTHGGVAVDAYGNAYVSGTAWSDESTFPDGDGFGSLPGPDQTYAGQGDAFAVKVNAAGTDFDYAGYIGGSEREFGLGMAVDDDGNAYAGGFTESDETMGFPVVGGPDLTHNGDPDGFVSKISADGTTLVYSGYVGGDGIDTVQHVAVDDEGHAYLTGQVNSTEATFPATGGPDLTYNGGAEFFRGDAYACKVQPEPDDAVVVNNFAYCGYIGGRRTDVGLDIAVDSLGAAYVTGDVLSDEETFPVTVGPDLTHNGGRDAFVAKIDRDSDGDGLLDGDEVRVHGTDPLDPDTDDDLLSDADEVLEFGTDPLDPDQDGDGLLDGKDVEFLQNVIAGLPSEAFTDESFSERTCRTFECNAFTGCQ